jgi:hypothetical protein
MRLALGLNRTNNQGTFSKNLTQAGFFRVKFPPEEFQQHIPCSDQVTTKPFSHYVLIGSLMQKLFRPQGDMGLRFPRALSTRTKNAAALISF